MSWLAPLDIGLQIGLIQAWAVVAFAVAFRLLMFPDLTVEGSVPMGAAVFAVLAKGGQPLPVAVLGAIAAGCLLGATTAFLHVRFNVNKFLAGIIVVAIAYSVSLRTMRGPNIGLLQLPSLLSAGVEVDKLTGPILHLGTSLSLGLVLAIALIAIGATLSSRLGLRVLAAGSNPAHARSLGISSGKHLIAGIAATNGLAAWGGALLASRQGFADVGMGQGMLILALASLALGERLVPKRRLGLHAFVLISALAGSVGYQVLVSYAIRLGLAATDLRLATAVLVLLVVARATSRELEGVTDPLK